jgi:hypothetical protein
MQSIEKYVSHLIEDSGFNEKDPDVIAQIKSDLLDRVENRINAMIIANLVPEKLPEFEKVLETGSETEIQDFTKKNIPDLEEKVAAELLDFKNIYLN